MQPSGLHKTAETIKSVKIPLLATSRGANAIALAYTAHKLILGGSKFTSETSFCQWTKVH